MKLTQPIADNPITLGDTNVKQATISSNKIKKLQYILTTGLYSDPITAVIAEITNNGIDGVVQAGKNPQENPVIVEIGTNEKGIHFFRVTDKGIGISKYEFENIVMNYLESTKEDDNDSIGYFGLGSKSFLGLERGALFTCRKDGIECKYYAFQGAEFCEYDLIHEIPTEEENGVIFEVNITDWREKNEFIRKAKEKLAYYDTVALIIDNNLITSSIFREEDFQWSTLNTCNKLHICLKDVFYNLDFNKLGISEVSIPIALRFGLKDGLCITPSRENIIYNENVKNIIKSKIVKVADFFTEKYNNTVEEFPDFLSAFHYINSDALVVNLNDTKFVINSISSHSNNVRKELTIKGISYKSPAFYKAMLYSFEKFYDIVGFYSSMGQYTSKKCYKPLNQIINKRSKIVIVSNPPVGNIKEFLKTKYGRDVSFITINNYESLLFYKEALNLNKEPKTKWRAIIEEYQNIGKHLIKHLPIGNEENILNSKEFLDFLENKKKLNKNRHSGGNYNSLNKQKDEVTISLAKHSRAGCKFVKQVFKIKDLHKQPHLFIRFTEEQRELAKDYFEVLKKNDTIQVCVIGKREFNRIPIIHNIKTLKQFMSRDCKPFQRIATAILFTKLVEDFETISSSSMEIFEKCLTSYVNDYNTIKVYVNDNYHGADTEIEEAILQAAESKDLFDKSKWDVYTRLKEGVKKFDFMACFADPDDMDETEKKRYIKTINQLLLFQKKYYNLDGYEIIKSPQPEIIVEEELSSFEKAMLDEDTNFEKINQYETEDLPF